MKGKRGYGQPLVFGAFRKSREEIEELGRVMADPDVVQRFAEQSAELRVLGPAAFATFLQSERIKWADVVKRSGAKLD